MTSAATSQQPTGPGERINRPGPGRRFLGMALLGLGLAAWPAWWAFASRRDQDDLERARAALRAGEFAIAGPLLERLSSRRPDWDPVNDAIGTLASAEGDVDRAIAAWSRIDPHSPLWPEATARRAKFGIEHGRFADAEDALVRLADERGLAGTGDDLRPLWQQLLLFTGRMEELRALYQKSFPKAGDRALLLKQHWLLDDAAYPVQAVRDRLDLAEEGAPDDDRLWLARANLAARSGQLAEADSWLARCEGRRPDDPAVARARLDWALAAGRPEAAAKAAALIPARGVEPSRRLALRAWFAARRGDKAAEQAALELAIELEPGDAEALDRLASLAAGRGDAAGASELRRRKAGIHAARDRYRALMNAGPAPEALLELARTAEAGGRPFEARGWWSLVAQDPKSAAEARTALERLDRADPDPPARNQDLAAWLGDVPSGTDKSEIRPATDALAVPEFRDEAGPSGLRFVYDSDRTKKYRLPETMGGGIGLLDFDGDGRLDVYCVQGGRLIPEGTPAPQGDRLFRNRGDGTFEDATGRSGIELFPGGYGHGATVGDVDNDGHPDLFVTRLRSYALYRNRGDGTFEDATERMGLGGERDWPTSAAFADLDNDGDLDLYVCHYAEWDPATAEPCDLGAAGRVGYCVPRMFKGMPDHVFRNDGSRFVDVTAEAGFTDPDGRGLGVVAADINDDGLVDLFVANDMTANYLFLNQGGFRFVEAGAESGVATNATGSFQAGMGVDCGDVDGDGRFDLLVTNFYGESTSFFTNLGGGLFHDGTAAVGLAAPTRFVLGFGLAVADVNNDGRPDVVQANGHVNDYRPAIPHAMPMQLFLNVGGGRLADASARAGPPWSIPYLGRGLARGDLDNDGRLDFALLAQDAPLAYLRNRGPAGRSLTLLLEGTASNRDAVGAKVVVTAGGRRQQIQRNGGGSFLSASDPRLHIGLGDADRAETVEVTWPSGRKDVHRDLKADVGGYRLIEGPAEPMPLDHWKAAGQ
jgi:hypothetical protein